MLNMLNGLFSSLGCVSSVVGIFISSVIDSLSFASWGFVWFPFSFLFSASLCHFPLLFRGTRQHETPQPRLIGPERTSFKRSLNVGSGFSVLPDCVFPWFHHFCFWTPIYRECSFRALLSGSARLVHRGSHQWFLSAEIKKGLALVPT